MISDGGDPSNCVSNSHLKWENKEVQLGKAETGGLSGINKQSSVLKPIMSWTNAFVSHYPHLHYSWSPLKIFQKKRCLSWMPLPYSPALEEFAGCTQMASVTIMMAPPWHLEGGWDVLGQQRRGLTKQRRRKDGRDGKIVRRRGFLLCCCRKMNLFNLWFHDSFWGTQSGSFVIIKNSSHKLAFMISAVCANTRTNSL